MNEEDWISIQFDKSTGSLFVKRGKPKPPEVETMQNGVRRVRLVLGVPIREGFYLCQTCGGWAYEKSYMHLFQIKAIESGEYGICFGCWPKISACRQCHDNVTIEEYKPGLPVETYCPGCAPKNKPLQLKQNPNMQAEVNILKLRRDKRWESSSSERTPKQ